MLKMDVSVNMNLLLSFSALQSRFAPFPKKLHVIFCIIATVAFIIIYFRTRKISNLLWMIACDTMLILQFYGDKATVTVIGILEVIVFSAIFVLYLKDKKAKKAGSPKSEDGRDDLEKAIKAERSKLANDTKDDVISQAFDNNDI